MFCENCGAKLPDDAVFCSECGYRLTAGVSEPEEINKTENETTADPYIPEPEQDLEDPYIPEPEQDLEDPYIPEPEEDKEVPYEPETPDGPEAPKRREKDPGKGNGKKWIIGIVIAVCAIAAIAAVYVFAIRPAMDKDPDQPETAGTETESVPGETEEMPETADDGGEVSFSGGSFTVTRSGTTDGAGSPAPETAAGETKAASETKETEAAAETKETEAPKNVVHEYQVIHGSMTWDEAKQYCEDQGGHLATITSQEEYDHVVSLLNESGLNVAWLGATDKDSVGSFKWVTGEEFSFADWAPGEPNNETGDEFYLVLYQVSGEWVWNDGPLDTNTYYSEDTVGFVCEWEKTE